MDFQEVMRAAADLTRRGRLGDATAAIQRALGGAAAPAPTARSTSGAPLVSPRARPSDRADVDRASPSDDVGPSQFVAGSFTHGGLTRRYKLFVPSTMTRPALVVMLHGCQQDPDDFARGTRANARAESTGTLVLYPAQAQEANGSGCWNWFRAQDQTRGQGEAALIAEMTRDVVRRYDADPDKVFVAGLSAGGAMAAILATEYPDLYAAACVHSGLPAGAARNLPDALRAMRTGAPARPRSTARGDARASATTDASVPMLVFHGDQDATVHPGNADAIVAAALRSARVSILDVPHRSETRDARGRRAVRTTYVDVNGRSLVEQWTLHGARHAWAGGSPEGSWTDAQGIDATAEMMRFFAEHPRTAALDDDRVVDA